MKSAFTNIQVTCISESMFRSGCKLHEKRANLQWIAVSHLENEVDEYPFKNLTDVIFRIWTISHSSTECERIFNKVKKIQTV